MRPVLRAACLSAALLLAGAGMGCAYRVDIQQGNLLDPEQVDQVEVGMTRSQVRFLLGTPMVIDTFNPDRWDYVYNFRQGRKRHVERRHLVVWFEGDKVTRVEEPIPVPRPQTTPEAKLEDKAPASG